MRVAGDSAPVQTAAAGMRRRDIGVLAVLVVVFLAGAAYLWVKDRRTEMLPIGEAVCPVAKTPTPIDAAEPVADPVPEVEAQDAVQVRNLERGRDRFSVRTFLSLSTPLEQGVDVLNVRVGQFQRADGLALEPEHVTVSATVDDDSRREVVEVLLCVDPIVNLADNLPALRAEAGSYTGTVFIDDPRVTGGSVSYTVNMKYHRIYLVLLVVLVAGFLGSVVGLALSGGVSWNSLGSNFHRTLVAIVGSASAVYLVYVAQYDRDPSWQGDTSLFTALFATSLGVAYTATNVAGTAKLERASEGEPVSRRGRDTDDVPPAEEVEEPVTELPPTTDADRLPAAAGGAQLSGNGPAQRRDETAGS